MTYRNTADFERDESGYPRVSRSKEQKAGWRKLADEWMRDIRRTVNEKRACEGSRVRIRFEVGA